MSIFSVSCFSASKRIEHYGLKKLNKTHYDHAAAECVSKSSALLNCSLSKKIKKQEDSDKETQDQQHDKQLVISCQCQLNKSEEIYRYLDFYKKMQQISSDDKTDNDDD